MVPLVRVAEMVTDEPAFCQLEPGETVPMLLEGATCIVK
jgi:hypothetical protein